ncbi:MAG: helicase-associated domain-containing protein [Anaerolineae bacterium]|nr:helicase-associated domain-containing protein [Anaerolineae bacterium]
MKTLRECLAEYDTALLRAIAQRRGVELAASGLPEIAVELTGSLLDPALIDEAMRWLTDGERRALDTLILNNGRLPMLRFTQQFGEIRRFGPASLAREAPWLAPISAAEGLWYQGLISRSFKEQDGISTEFAFIPSDLLPHLPPPQTTLMSFDVAETERPHRIEMGDVTLIDDMCMLLALVQTDEVRIQAGQLPPDIVSTLQKQFWDEAPARLEFLFHLAQMAGLISVEGRQVRLHRDPVRDWLKGMRAGQLHRLQLAWRDDPSWNELWHVPTIVCEETGWSNDPFVARQAVLELLKRCRSDAWLSISDFVEAVKRQLPDYLRPDGDFDSWYIRDRRTNQYLTGLEHWDKIEGALLAYFFEGPLHWLGMVSLGYREGWQKPTAIRLTAWGTAFLGLTELSEAQLPEQPAQISPEGRITLPREASLYDRFQLARIGEWRASRPDYVFEITSEALRRAFGEKIEVDMVENFLSRIGQGQLPAATVARIRALASRYGHVRLRRAAILETRTPKTMLDLNMHERIRPYLRQQISPTAVLVRESDWDLLIQELERAGYLPEIVDH